VSLTKLIGTIHNICKGRSSTPDHLTLFTLKLNFYILGYLTKKKYNITSHMQSLMIQTYDVNINIKMLEGPSTCVLKNLLLSHLKKAKQRNLFLDLPNLLSIAYYICRRNVILLLPHFSNCGTLPANYQVGFQ